MFGFGTKARRQRRVNSRPKNVRARDGLVRAISSERRARRKYGGNSARAQRRVVKENRAYKKGDYVFDKPR